jgi:septum site-determining protein MinC
MSKKVELVQIKGQKEGLWIFLDDHISTQELFSALDHKLSSASNFFAGAEVTINTGTRTFSSSDVEQLYNIVENKYALHIKNIEEAEPGKVERSETGEAETEDDFMKALDETFRIPVKQKWFQKETYSPEQLYEQEEKTLYFRGTVRSGQSLEFPGNIVILGDVNPGAYVIASGDIIVMGRLNGVVHAGAEGEERAIVIGASFFPSQLRIAQYIGRPPDESPQSATNRARTEKASVKDGTIVLEPIL